MCFSFFLPPGWRDSLIGIVLGGGSLWLMGELYFRLRHEEGMGFGDVKMLAMIGAFLGWKLMLLTLVLSSFLGSIVGVAMIALQPGRHEIRPAVRHVPRDRRHRGGDGRRPHRRVVRVVLLLT